MKNLTDEILRSEIQTNSTAGIIFLFGMLFIVLLVIIKLYLHNKKMDNNPKSIKKYVYPTLIGIVCFWLSFFIFKAFTFKASDEWYLTEDNVIRTFEKKEVAPAGVRKTHYYAIVPNNDKVGISKALYEEIHSGEEVYVLRKKDGSAVHIYLKTDYFYVGKRLR